jgi:DNA repair protein RadC
MGPSSLADHELVAAVLGAGTRRQGSLSVAASLLDRAGGVHGLLAATVEELRAVAGVGPAKAARLLAAVELGRRTLTRDPADRVALRTPRDAALHLLPEYGARPVEHFGIVLLDAKHRLLKTLVLFVGTLDRSVVHPREIFREAAAARAASIILFHNHPSADPTPSLADVELTQRLVAAGTLMGIDVVDHLILSATRYCSLRETGRLE